MSSSSSQGRGHELYYEMSRSSAWTWGTGGEMFIKRLVLVSREGKTCIIKGFIFETFVLSECHTLADFLDAEIYHFEIKDMVLKSKEFIDSLRMNFGGELPAVINLYAKTENRRTPTGMFVFLDIVEAHFEDFFYNKEAFGKPFMDNKEARKVLYDAVQYGALRPVKLPETASPAAKPRWWLPWATNKRG